MHFVYFCVVLSFVMLAFMHLHKVAFLQDQLFPKSHSAACLINLVCVFSYMFHFLSPKMCFS